MNTFYFLVLNVDTTVQKKCIIDIIEIGIEISLGCYIEFRV